MVMCQRLPPVARSRDTLQTGLEGIVATLHQLSEQVGDPSRTEHDVGVDEQDPTRAAAPHTQRSSPWQAAALVTQDPCTGLEGEVDGAVRGASVHHDDLSDTRLTQGLQTAWEQDLRVAGRNDRGDLGRAVAH
jgi:hypothetical protein